MSKSQKQQFNSTVTIKDKELSPWLRALLFMCSVSSDSRDYYFQLLNRIKFLQQKCGNTWVVKYLKEANRLVMVWVSQPIEYRKTTVRSVGMPVKISGGLPCIIPTPLRRKMEEGDMKTVKVVLSVLNLYRVWRCEPILKLETITLPFGGMSSTLPITEIRYARSLFRFGGNPRPVEGLNITTAGPNFKISSLSAPFDSYTYAFKPECLSSFEGYSQATGNLDWFNQLQEECARLQNWAYKEWMSWISPKPLMLGKLAKKFEAAGKVRVFAITDWWTQNLLKPLHDWLNDGLSKIQEDGTFDQLAPLRRLTGKFRVSYDLSAATDRLPVDFQIQVLSQFLNQEAALNWASLLTKREWFLQEGGKWVPYRYAVGQPMGAYSSFPMLALSHHVIVQIAAKRAGYTSWFSNYALLGDDIVIACPKVAPHYLFIMRDTLGVDINLSKSLESDSGVCEFAKRLFKEEQDLSPVSPKVLLLALRNIFFLPDLVRDLVDKGYEVDTSSLLALTRKPRIFKGCGKVNVYKAVWSCFSPFGPLDRSPIRFHEIGSIGHELLFEMRDWILAQGERSLKTAIERSHIAKSSWDNAREQERGGLPGEVLLDLPSTKVLDSVIYGTPLANLFGYKFPLNLYREGTDADKVWFYVIPWLEENLSKLTEPAVSVSDLLGPKEQKVSFGQKAWDFWSMVHEKAKLPKIKRHFRPKKKQTEGGFPKKKKSSRK